MRRARRLRLLVTATAVVVGGSTLSACVGGSAPYSVTATFSNAEGLFPGNAVDALGVPVGTVSTVVPVGDHVVVTMSIDGSQPLPAAADAALVSPELLGEPSIEISPGYSGGPRLADGASIPLDRTSVPVSTDQLLKDLQQYLGAVQPQTVGTLVANLAQDLQGQGAALNTLLADGSGTLALLAQKGDDLGQLDGSLADVTQTLRQRSATVAQLIDQYDTVSGVLAQNSGPLGDAVSQLADANAQISSVLAPNLQPLQGDVATVTQVGRTLDRNLGNLDQGLSSAVALFTATGNAVDPVHEWINLNDQIPAGLTSDYVAGLLRDRLAGVCRRVLASHSSGLSAGAVATLTTCGNPDSGYFDGLLAVIPGLLGQLSGSTGTASAPSAQQVFSQGLSQIPGLSPGQSSSLSAVAPSSLASPAPSGSTLDPGAQLAPMTTQPTQTTAGSSSSSGGLSGLLHGLLGVVHFFGSIW